MREYVQYLFSVNYSNLFNIKQRGVGASVVFERSLNAWILNPKQVKIKLIIIKHTHIVLSTIIKHNVGIVVEKLHLSRLELGFVTLESGALPACPFPAGTLISFRAVYLLVHCTHFIALSIPFHYSILHYNSTLPWHDFLSQGFYRP